MLKGVVDRHGVRDSFSIRKWTREMDSLESLELSFRPTESFVILRETPVVRSEIEIDTSRLKFDEKESSGPTGSTFLEICSP